MAQASVRRVAFDKVNSRTNILAWSVTLAVSLLPDVLWSVIAAHPPQWLFAAKIAFLASFIAVGFRWDAARSLRGYFLMLMALFVLDEVRQRLEISETWSLWFGGVGATFLKRLLGTQLLRVGSALVTIVLLLSLGYRFPDFFLARGNLRADAAPIRWLGINRPVSWLRLAPISALCIGAGTAVFLVIGGRPSPAAILGSLSFLPMVLVLAAMNAFAEELSFRGSLLAPLKNAVSSSQAVMLTAVFFGIGHYYGVPYGPIGVVMAGFLGWFLGRCMTETRGMLWPWFIHFVQDALIFSFMAIGSVVAGGGR